MTATKDYLEDVSETPLDPELSITDEELQLAGLVPITAFMRTRSSKNAERIRKSREKTEAGSDDTSPRKQLNLTAPADDQARDALKALSAALIDGDTTPDLIKTALNNSDAVRIGKHVQRVLADGGLKALLLRRLLS